MTNSASLLRARALKLHFDDGQIQALAGVDLDVAEGEFVAITGPSGCGKSSLLSLIGRLEQPTSGELYFRGQPYSTFKDASLFRRTNIGFVFQSFHLIATLTALDNILVPTVGAPAQSEPAETRARTLMQRMGLGHRLNHYPAQLSGGERQRVALVRALINNPPLILADEPTGSLDSANAEQVLDLLREFRRERGLTVIMVTHDGNVSACADRIVAMRDGKVVSGGVVR